jgi:tetratricopeptide (TPR) repeat protein
VAACGRAARAAIASLGFDDAIRWAQTGLDLIGGRDSDDRDALELDLAEGLYRAGRPEDALRPCRAVMDRAAATGRADLAARAALVIRGIGGPVAAEVLTLCDRAEVLLRDDETGDHAQVLAQRAIVLIEFGRIAESAELASRALQLAEASEDPDALLLALHARHDALTGPDDIVERLAVAERAGQLARGRANRADVAFWAHLWRIEDNLQLGRMDEVARNERSLVHLVDTLGWPIGRWHLVRLHAALALMGGDFPAAIAATEEGVELALDLGEGPLTRDHGVSSSLGLRLHRAVEGTSAILVLRVPHRLTGSVAALVVELHRRQARWIGVPRPTRLAGLDSEARILRSRSGGAPGAGAIEWRL